jgi:nitrate reductase alpha subunit
MRNGGEGGPVGGLALENWLGLVACVRRGGAGWFHKIIIPSLRYRQQAWFERAISARFSEELRRVNPTSFFPALALN